MSEVTGPSQTIKLVPYGNTELRLAVFPKLKVDLSPMPGDRVVNPGPQHAELAFNFLCTEGKGGSLITDAHLAALAVEFRGTIYTADTDFLRFPGVQWMNPPK